jgi:hypothetical protein
MQQLVEPKDLFAKLHREATDELLQLMDGFYSNIEDGLFELAYANEDQTQQRNINELMRELRFRRKTLIKTFGKLVRNAARSWCSEVDARPTDSEESILANQMATKCASHFGQLLRNIAERTAHAINHDVDAASIPVSPEQVSLHFVMSCRWLHFDQSSIETVQTLFGRFVLERLGHIYGQINATLEEAGYLTVAELEAITVNSKVG